MPIDPKTTDHEPVQWTESEQDEILRLHIIEGLIVGDAMRRVFNRRSETAAEGL